jgi:hypothetical protein
MFNPNQAFLFVKKLKSAPKFFTLEVKVELEKKYNMPKGINKCRTLWPHIGPKVGRRIPYHQIWEANMQPLGGKH